MVSYCFGMTKMIWKRARRHAISNSSMDHIRRPSGGYAGSMTWMQLGQDLVTGLFLAAQQDPIAVVPSHPIPDSGRTAPPGWAAFHLHRSRSSRRSLLRYG